MIGHLDADCFYVSAERVRDPFLHGKPVGVLGNQGACVIAKSYEMKAAGVTTGEPIWEALKKCPQGIFIKRDFRWYEVLSRRLLDITQRFSPEVEYYSIDEFFFRGEPSRDFAQAIRDTILQESSLPVTVGIARTRTLAKLVSDTAKPFGVRVLSPEEESSLLASRPVMDVCGIGSRRAARLEPFGIKTALDFARADRRLIRSLLTVVGEALWWELNGEPVTPFRTDRPPHKEISRGGSLGESTSDPDRVVAWLTRNMERLVEELYYHVVFAGRFVLYVGHPFGGNSWEVDLISPTDRFDLLMEAGRYCLDKAWNGRQPVNRMHLIATHLVRPGFVQQGLFQPPEKKAREVAKVKREVNSRLGRFTLRSGATLPLYGIYRDDAQSYDVCDVHGKMCF